MFNHDISNSFGKFDVMRFFGMFCRQIVIIFHDFRALWKKSFCCHFGQFRAYWYFWLRRSTHFLKSIKMALSCREIISTRRALLYSIPKLISDSKNRFSYAWCAQKMRRTDSTGQSIRLVEVSKKAFFDNCNWVLPLWSINFLNLTNLIRICLTVIPASGVLL